MQPGIEFDTHQIPIYPEIKVLGRLHLQRELERMIQMNAACEVDRADLQHDSNIHCSQTSPSLTPNPSEVLNRLTRYLG